MRYFVGLVLIAAVAGLALPGGKSAASHPLAAAGDYEIVVSDCWEPDIKNTSGQTVTFAVQAAIREGQQSEIQMTAALAPGEIAHLHLFEEHWFGGTLHLLMAEANAQGCDLVLRTVSSAGP